MTEESALNSIDNSLQSIIEILERISSHLYEMKKQ